jgi:CelD/BcsL family acetyltransferase involved in cellulose biosynthesis
VTLSTAVIDTSEGFAALRGEWDELLHASARDNFFLTWDWLHTWYRHLGGDRRLHIVTVRDEQARLVALAPLALRPRRWLRLMPFRTLEFLGRGNVGTDYLSVLARKDCEDAALRVLADRLTRDCLALEFSHVDREDIQMRDTAAALRTRGWHGHESTIETCPYIGLEGHTWDTYLAALGRTHRTNFKRKLKKLQSLYNLRIDEATTEAGRRAALDILVNLHLKRRREVGGSDALHTRELLAFHEELTATALRSGLLRLHVMWLDDAPVAAMYGFEYNKSFFFYQSGFDSAYATHSVGLVMTGLAIRSALERGVREFDFLHGNEAYKYLWASAERELVRFELFPPDSTGAFLHQLMQARRGLKRLLTRKPPAPNGTGPALTPRPAPAWNHGARELES